MRWRVAGARRQGLIRFDASQRTTLEAALAHPFLAGTPGGDPPLQTPQTPGGDPPLQTPQTRPLGLVSGAGTPGGDPPCRPRLGQAARSADKEACRAPDYEKIVFNCFRVWAGGRRLACFLVRAGP